MDHDTTRAMAPTPEGHDMTTNFETPTGTARVGDVAAKADTDAETPAPGSKVQGSDPVGPSVDRVRMGHENPEHFFGRDG